MINLLVVTGVNVGSSRISNRGLLGVLVHRSCFVCFIVKFVHLLTVSIGHVDDAHRCVVLSCLHTLAHIAALKHLLQVLIQAVTELHKFLGDILHLEETFLGDSLLSDLLELLHYGFFALALTLLYLLNHRFSVAHTIFCVTSEAEIGLVTQVSQICWLLYCDRLLHLCFLLDCIEVNFSTLQTLNSLTLHTRCIINHGFFVGLDERFPLTIGEMSEVTFKIVFELTVFPERCQVVNLLFGWLSHTVEHLLGFTTSTCA